MRLWRRRGAGSPPSSQPDASTLQEAGVELDGFTFSPQLVTLFGTPADAATRLRQTAADVLSQHVSFGRRGLAIISTARGAGVTFVTANLGVALAQVGLSTLIIDANLKRPGLHELIQPPDPNPGLASLMARSDLSLLDVAREEVLPNLSVLYAGQDDAAPEEPLGGARFEVLVTTCLRRYECVLFDTPPANASADARRIGTLVSYALIVARRDVTFAADLEILKGELEQDGVAVVGSILNGA